MTCGKFPVHSHTRGGAKSRGAGSALRVRASPVYTAKAVKHHPRARAGPVDRPVLFAGNSDGHAPKIEGPGSGSTIAKGPDPGYLRQRGSRGPRRSLRPMIPARAPRLLHRPGWGPVLTVPGRGEGGEEPSCRPTAVADRRGTVSREKPQSPGKRCSSSSLGQRGFGGREQP